MAIWTGEPLIATETPEILINRMLAMAEIDSAQAVLEPSAGDGRLALAAARRGAAVSAIELNEGLYQRMVLARQAAIDADEIIEERYNVLRGDFLTLHASANYDRVVMNPPKDNVTHVVKAFEWLRPRGILVALIHTHNLYAIYARLGIPYAGSDLRLDATLEGARIRVECDPLPEEMFEFAGEPLQASLLKLRKPSR